mmetsp:Transcript_10994/g.33452  ORF Transcript_10994/g.33452 Transcript_10994/m.33452 type:complete len:223 (+) Transcript_10994:272-940(+)
MRAWADILRLSWRRRIPLSTRSVAKPMRSTRKARRAPSSQAVHCRSICAAGVTSGVTKKPRACANSGSSSLASAVASSEEVAFVLPSAGASAAAAEGLPAAAASSSASAAAGSAWFAAGAAFSSPSAAGALSLSSAAGVAAASLLSPRSAAIASSLDSLLLPLLSSLAAAASRSLGGSQPCGMSYFFFPGFRRRWRTTASREPCSLTSLSAVFGPMPLMVSV